MIQILSKLDVIVLFSLSGSIPKYAKIIRLYKVSVPFDKYMVFFICYVSVHTDVGKVLDSHQVDRTMM